MNRHYIYSLLAVVALFLLAYVGAQAFALRVVLGVVVPYAALLTFLVGFGVRVMGWARSPVPFRIPTTCGQQKTLPWFKPAVIENPTSTWAVIVRMFFEIITFRSLFRNTRMGFKGGRITYQQEVFLWVGALAFHYAFLTVILRHLRFFTEPVPAAIQLLERLDSFMQVGLPGLYLSSPVLLAAVLYLFVRRVFIPHLRYISLAADFFPLFLIGGIALSGILMRHFAKIDVTAAKELAMGLVTLRPTVPDGIGATFYVHLLFVSVLLAYFPFSKLMHLGGIFLSPTRNMTTDTRVNRHVNPWNYPVPVHTYDEYEDEFRDKMVEAGLPVDKQPEPSPPDEKE